jgi:hypothetical protein
MFNNDPKIIVEKVEWNETHFLIVVEHTNKSQWGSLYCLAWSVHFTASVFTFFWYF